MPENLVPPTFDVPVGAGIIPPVVPTPKKSPLLISILLILLSLVATFAIYLLNQVRTLTLEKLTPSPTASARALASPDPTADWKKYTNQKFNFTFQYPKDLVVLDEINRSGDRLLIQTYDDKDPTGAKFVPNFQMVFFLNNNPGRKLESYPEYWDKEFNETFPTEKFMVDGLSAIKGYSDQKQEPVPTVWVINDNYLYTVQLSTPTSSNKKYFDQILSTFKFTTNQ